MQLQSYTLRIDMIHCGSPNGCLRGVVEHLSSEAPIAFNGLFELWRAIKYLDKDVTIL